MSQFETISNPFPQVGTPESIDIDPAGYDKQFESIKNMISANIGKQQMIINVFGEYGQGKTTILKYLTKIFKESDNLTVAKKTIEWDDNSPNKINFDELMQSLYDEHKEKKTDGILLALDEFQQIAKDDTLSEEKSEYLSFIRNFADNNIENVDCREFILCIAMHPQTDLFFKEKGHLDIEQRAKTFFLNLVDLDYYSAYMVVKRYFNKRNLNFEDFIDESFINSFFMLLPHVRFEKEAIKSLNGRTFVQMFHILLNFYNEKKKRLSFKDNQDILLGKINIKLKTIPIVLPNLGIYDEIKNNLSSFNSECLKIMDKFIFNPRWHFNEEILTENNQVIKSFIDYLEENGYISKRQCILIDPNKIADESLLNQLKNLESERIFLNGIKKLFFIDLADQDTLKLIEKAGYEVKIVYRLRSEYLTLLYDFDLDNHSSDEVVKYYKLIPADKVKTFIDQVKTFSIESDINSLKSLKTKSFKTGHRYLDGFYTVVGKLELNIAIFYYSEDYSDSLDDFIFAIQKELNESAHDLGVLFLCPFTKNKLENQKPSEIRLLENRLTLTKLNDQELKSILEGDLTVIKQTIKDSIRLYTQEAVNKGFILPLTGFKEGISNSPNKFAKAFFGDIKKSWKIFIDINDGDQAEFTKSKLLEEGVDGQLKELAINSLNEFIKINDNEEIIGSKISKYEKNFYEILLQSGGSLTSTDLKIIENKFYSSYSRFNILKMIPEILEIKSIITKENGSYSIIKPSDFFELFLMNLNSIDYYRILANNKEKAKFKLLLVRFNTVFDQFRNKLPIEQLGYYNYEMKRINNKLTEFTKEDKITINQLEKKYKSILSKLQYSFLDISVKEVSSKDSELNSLEAIYSKTLEEYKKIINLNQEEKEILSLLEDTLNKLRDHSSSNLTLINESISNINQMIELSDSSEAEIINLIKNTLQNKSMMPNHLLLILNNLLEEVDANISILYEKLKKCTDQLEEIKKVQSKGDTYTKIIGKMSKMDRYDYYLSSLELEDFFNPITLDEEYFDIKTLVKGDINLVDGYLEYILKASGKDYFEKIKNIESKIKKMESKDIFEYYEYLNGLNFHDYCHHQLKLEFRKNKINKDDLERFLILLQKSEDSDIENKVLINNLLRKGFLQRSIHIMDYFDENIHHSDKKFEFQLRSIK